MRFLLSDILLYLLLIIAVIFGIVAVRRPQSRAAWQQVMQQPLAIISSVILLFFIVITLLDSIHFAHGVENTSMLDKIFSPLGKQLEKTYSAPFAVNLFTSEIKPTPNGSMMKVYARLQYAGKSIANSQEKYLDLSMLTLKGLAFGALGFFLWVMITGSLLIKKPLERLRSNPHLRLWYLSWAVLFLITAVLFEWSRHYHILGTDQVGQDIFYLTIKSIRTGVLIGTITTLLMLPFAIILGITAGYFGGIVDDFIQYIYTTLSSIPGVLLIAATILSMQIYLSNHPDQFVSLDESADMRLLALCMILGVTSWTSLCRLLRAETLKLREMDFIKAAKVLGTSKLRILFKHILPNVMHIVLITVVLDFSMLVLAEAVLSYVGVGVAPTTTSWGNMINSARLELAREPMVWWPITAAFIFMFLLVLSANLFSDAVRDAFDPRSRR